MSETLKSRVPTPAEMAAALDPDALISIEVVAALTSLAPVTLRRMVRDGLFPEPVHINQRVVRWVAGDVRRWLKAQAAPPVDPVIQAARLMGVTLPALSTSR